MKKWVQTATREWWQEVKQRHHPPPLKPTPVFPSTPPIRVEAQSQKQQQRSQPISIPSKRRKAASPSVSSNEEMEWPNHPPPTSYALPFATMEKIYIPGWEDTVKAPPNNTKDYI
jgi:hypothetical protein